MCVCAMRRTKEEEEERSHQEREQHSFARNTLAIRGQRGGEGAVPKIRSRLLAQVAQMAI